MKLYSLIDFWHLKYKEIAEKKLLLIFADTQTMQVHSENVAFLIIVFWRASLYAFSYY